MFPNDSAYPPSGNVPARTNSPADVEIDVATRDVSEGTLGFVASLVNANFSVANTVVSGINKAPNNTGGAIYINGGNMTVRNSTFTGNQAPTGGAIAIANPASGSTLLNNVTMRADSASSGSELSVSGTIAASAIAITNSLISGTCAGLTSPIAHNSIESPGNTCALPAG